MWYKDTPGHQDKRTTDNKRFTSRKALTAQGKSVQMMGKLHLDLFCQEKYLLNDVNLKIKLRRSRDVFALMADANNYQIKIKDFALFVRNVQLSPAVRMGHVKALEKTSCKYSIRCIEVKVDIVPRGNMNYVQDNMCLGQLPKRLVIGCIDSDALNGTITENPFDFKHFKINFVALNVDGRQKQITQTIKCTFGPCGKYGSRPSNGTTLGSHLYRRQLKRGILRPHRKTTPF